MYVAAKGGERAIRNARALLASARRGDPRVPESRSASITTSALRGSSEATGSSARM